MPRILSIAVVSLLLSATPVAPASATWIFSGESPAAALAEALPTEYVRVSEAPPPRLPAASGGASLSLDPPAADLDRALGFSAICRESDPVLDSALKGALPLGSERPPEAAPPPLLGDWRLR